MVTERMARMKRADIVIGIDPDVEMSGVARVDVAKGTAWADTLPLPLLLDYVAGVALDSAVTVVVVVEASWASSHNWHVRPCGGARAAAKTGYNVGRNHQTGMDIVELLRHRGISVVEKQPLVKIWSGKDGKITHDEMTSICGWGRTRSNQEERDALLLAWDHAGLPMRIMRKK